MANNITVKDASNNNIQIKTIEDSTSVHHNMSIPITVSGIPIFTTAAPGIVSLADSVVQVSISPTQGNIPVSVVGNVGLNAGTNLLGGVSVRQIVSVQPDGATNWPVSIAGTPAVTINDNAPVSVRGGRVSIADSTLAVIQSGTWTVQPGNTANTTPWLVSVNGIPKVSVADSTLAVTQSGTWNIAALTSVNSIVKVSIEGSLTVSGSTLVVSVGGATSTQAVPIAFRDTGGDARQPLLTTGGALIVHVCNAQAAPSSDVSVSPSQGSIPVSIAGGNINIADNAPVSVRGGRVSIADSTLAVTQSGTWNVGINAGTNLIGAVSVRQIVSVQPDGTTNWPVSIAGTPTVNIGSVTGNIGVSVINPTFNLPVSVHPVTQSGTWNVGLNAGTNLVGAVSVRQIVSVQPDGTTNWPVSIAGTPTVTINDNAPVSVRGGILSAVSLGGGTAQVGRVSVFVDQVPFNVSINNTLPVPVSVVGGRVSIQGISQVSVAGAVTVSPLTNTGSAVPNGAFFVGGTDGTNLRALLVDALGALQVAGAVTNAEASFTRPADTTAYASGDLVANNTTAGSVTPMAFAVSKFSTGGGQIFIRRARIVKSTGSLTNAQFRLHLYATSNGVTNQGVSVVGGDNAAYTASKVSAYLGYMSVTMAVSHSDGACGWAMPNEGMEMNLKLPSAQFNIQGLLEARAAYTPGNTERFNVTLEAYQE